MKKNEMTVTKRNSLLKELEKEINADYQKQIKDKAKKLIQEIKMTEILLQKQKEKLDVLLTGKSKYTEEELLFDD